jgi:DNA polymerase I
LESTKVIVQALSDLPNLTDAKSVLFDTETSGLSPYHGDRICGIAISPYEATSPDHNYYIPIRHREHDDGFKSLPLENVYEWMKPYVKDPAKRWFGHNLQFDINMLRADRQELTGDVLDTMIVGHVFDGDLWNYSLDSLTRLYVPGFEHRFMKEKDAWLKENQCHFTSDEGEVAYNYATVPIPIMGAYALEDLEATRRLAQHFYTKPLWDAIPNQGNSAWSCRQLIKNEMQLVKVLADLTWNGVKIDVLRCIELRNNANDLIEQLNDQLYKLSGKSFSVASGTQTADALCRAGGRVLFWTKKKDEKGKQKRDQYTSDKAASTGRPCFNSEAILDYLKVFKQEKNERAYTFMLRYYKSEQTRRVVTANLDAYLKGVDANNRLHASFLMHGTVTGRLASKGPNLQNICKNKGTKEQGQIEKFTDDKDEEALNRQIRDLFICEPGNVLISMDYSSIEYRLATYFSCDAELINTYVNDPEIDFHQITADMLSVSRDVGKTLGFGILYGMGINSMASALNITHLEAAALRNKFYNTRPAFRDLISRIGDQVKRNGGVKNPFGRWVHVDPEKSYKGLNAMVQGSAADLMRFALVDLAERIKKEMLKILLVSDIHDEFLSEVPKEQAVEMAAKMKETVCRCPMFKPMPITCSAEIGNSWGFGLKSIEDWLSEKTKAA